MGLSKFKVNYITDFGDEAIITIQYQYETSEERLRLGNLQQSFIYTSAIIRRKYLKPRYLVLFDLGRVYFKTHEEMINYARNNSNNIKEIVGEQMRVNAFNYFSL